MNRLPDGPIAPRWWQLFRWISDPLGYLDECSRRYGDLFTFRLQGFPPLVFTSRPELVQQIFSLDAKQFDEGKGNGIVLPLVGENSLFLMDGDRHKRERKLLLPPFHGERVQTYSRIILDATREVMARWRESEVIDARAAMQDITLEVILQAVFGLREGARYREIKPLLADMLNVTDSPLRSSLLFFKSFQRDWGAWSPWGQFVRRRERIHALLQEEIDARRVGDDRSGDDVLSLMMAATDEDGKPMSDVELRDESITLLIAGHETTATSLAWAFYSIATDSEVREKLREELDSLGENPDPIALAKLSYLTAVCNETLRLYPVTPVAFTRFPRGSIELDGYRYEGTVGLTPCIYLVHQREDIYPEPKRFSPDRFLDRSYGPGEFLPFGGGSRRCLGQALAMLELKLVLGTILADHDLDFVSDRTVRPARRGVTIAPSGGVSLRVSKRQRTRSPVYNRT
ncbi:cytochrome P450 [Pannus brasiliensis CCIBt3594]|uniref:Cytochrome P450 n=1 Tax=Pannus brasiliensis CCIBt3594 TaxID=1427578 RepID=A0AAW9QUX1_9CHRO